MEAENNNPRRVASCGGHPVHLNGSATITPADIEVKVGSENKISTSLVIRNGVSGAGDLLVSLDGGSDFFTIEHGIPLKIEVITEAVTVKSSIGTVPYEIIATY